MYSHRSATASAAAAIALCVGAIALAVGAEAEAQVSRPPLVLEPLGTRGEAIFPAFEGWGPDKSGENMLLLLGYYNRNKNQEIVEVWPFAVMDQVSRLLPKSFGTLMAKTPCCRPL